MSHHDTIRAHLTRILLLVALASLAGGGGFALAQAPARPASLDDILKEISSYDGGIDSAAFWKLRDYVQARKDDQAGRAECETKLLAFLKTRATPVARMAACRWLRVIAGDQAVPALQALLLDDRSVDMALYVLQQIRGAAADKALLEALPKVAGPAKIAVIAALGERGCADAVRVLEPLLAQPEFGRPAALALGTIGGDAASRALLAAYARAAGDLKPVVAASIVKCAEKLLTAQRSADALRLYELLSADMALPVPLRKAAAMGRISAAGGDARKILIGYLEGSDVGMQEAAIARIAAAFGPDAIAPICALLPRLPEQSQVKLLAVLAGYSGDRVLPTILDAARSRSQPVRIAAMKALESTGGPSEVALLAETAAGTSGAEQAAARSALGMLKGRAVDEAIIALMVRKPTEERQPARDRAGQGFSLADPRVEVELLRAVGERRIFPAKPAVAASLTSSAPQVRLQALRALRSIGTPSDMNAVLDVIVKTDDDSQRAEAEKTTAVLAQKIASADRRAGPIRARLAAQPDAPTRAKLIAVLPMVGDDSTLPLLRAALDNADPQVSDAAVRALVAWPTSAARDDVLQLARDSRNETHRLLAIRGLVRIVGLDRYRDPEAAVADLRQAAGFAWRPEEQKLVLAALVQFPCRDGMDLAAGFLREPSVTAEAQVAIDRIKARLEAMRKRGTV